MTCQTNGGLLFGKASVRLIGGCFTASVFLICHNAASTPVVTTIVAAPESIDHDAAGGVRGVDKVTLADVESDVRNGIAVTTEEYQIAGLEVCLIDMHTVTVLLLRTSCEGIAKMLVNIQDKAGAVERVRSVAAIDVGIALEALGKCNKVLHQG